MIADEFLLSATRLREDVVGEAIAFCRGELADLGYQITTTQDFQAVREITREMGKEYFTPALDPLFNDFTADNCFWQLLIKDGEVCVCGGVRHEALGSTPVSQFWRNSFKRLYGGGICDQVIDVSPAVDSILRGDLVYFGDLHVAPKFRGHLDILSLYLCHGQALVSMKWNPDFTYAFIHDRFVANGAAFRYGFNTVERMAQHWVSDAPYPRSTFECCAIADRAQLLSFFSRPERILSRGRRGGA